MLVSIPLFEQSQRLSIHLPDFFNLKFSMPFVLRCFLLILFFPSKFHQHSSQISVNLGLLLTFSLLYENDPDVQKAEVPVEKEEERLRRTFSANKFPLPSGISFCSGCKNMF